MEQNYAVMRHAQYADNQEITENGKLQISSAAEKLNKFFAENGITEFQIWHSPLKRARLTGEILKESLQVPCVSFTEKRFLDCSNYQIQNNLPNEEVFVLMISHQPDIEDYLYSVYKARPNVGQCNIFVGSDRL